MYMFEEKGHVKNTTERKRDHKSEICSRFLDAAEDSFDICDQASKLTKIYPYYGLFSLHIQESCSE